MPVIDYSETLRKLQEISTLLDFNVEVWMGGGGSGSEGGDKASLHSQMQILDNPHPYPHHP